MQLGNEEKNKTENEGDGDLKLGRGLAFGGGIIVKRGIDKF